MASMATRADAGVNVVRLRPQLFFCGMPAIQRSQITEETFNPYD